MNDEDSAEPLKFHGLDLDAVIKVSSRNLPHWFQPGVATFVTFRTIDSMPQSALDLWSRRLRQFLRAHNIDDSIPLPESLDRLPDAIRRVFQRYRDSTYHRILDQGFGKCLLRDPNLAAIVAETLLYSNGTRYDLDRFVVMPNHVHLLGAFRAEFDMRHSLESCLHYSAMRINEALGTQGAFWQAEPFDHCVRNEAQFDWLQRYIKDNPRKARLHPSNYLYWERT